MRWAVGLVVLIIAVASGWSAVSKHGGRSEQLQFLTAVATYLSPALVALVMAFGVDAGWTRSWSRVAKWAYVSSMLFLIFFGLSTLVLFVQRPRMGAASRRRLARNCAVGSLLLMLVISGLYALR